ncbi:hypothetical protein P4283_01260 [Bacillus thuringiensis]|nr:hypothetical protein [Bacillus thuringiensis]
MTGVLSCTIVSATLVPAHAFSKTTDKVTYVKTHQQSAEEYEANTGVNSITSQSESNTNMKKTAKEDSKVSVVEKIGGLWRAVGGALMFDVAKIFLDIVSKLSK